MWAPDAPPPRPSRVEKWGPPPPTHSLWVHLFICPSIHPPAVSGQHGLFPRGLLARVRVQGRRRRVRRAAPRSRAAAQARAGGRGCRPGPGGAEGSLGLRLRGGRRCLRGQSQIRQALGARGAGRHMAGGVRGGPGSPPKDNGEPVLPSACDRIFLGWM